MPIAPACYFRVADARGPGHGKQGLPDILDAPCIRTYCKYERFVLRLLKILYPVSVGLETSE